MFKSLKKPTLDVTKLDPKFVMNLLAEYRAEHGETVLSITHALGLGTIMADYHTHHHALPEASNELGLADIYQRFTSMAFYENNTRLDLCTVGINDCVNKRDIYVMVNAMGKNHVFYQNTPDEARIGEVALIASSLMRRSMRMEPVWKDGNNHDKVLACSLFGFEYNKADDEILVPHGIMESAMTLSNALAVETVQLLNKMN